MIIHPFSNQSLKLKGIIGILSLIIMVTFYSCDSSDIETTDQTGDLSFQVEWEAAAEKTAGGENETLSANTMDLDCDDLHIAWVKAVVYNRYDELLAESPRWECSAHTGTIEGVKKGLDRWVVILGMDEDLNIIYRGQISEVEVIENQVTDAGLVVAHYFVPAGGSYNSATDRLTWLPVIGATSYEIQVAEDDDFILLNANMTTENLMSDLLGLSSGSYYMRIRAIDSFGNQSAWSETWGFDVP